MTILKTIGALLAALVVTFALSMGTDLILGTNGVIPKDNLNVVWWLVVIVIGYRTVYNVIGSYVAAKLAPKRPMLHALGLGVFGAVLGTAATIAMWNMDVGPHWYGLTLAVLSVPSAWLGGKLAGVVRVKSS